LTNLLIKWILLINKIFIEWIYRFIMHLRELMMLLTLQLMMK